MKNWKRLTALGLSAMMLASLAGCSTTTSKTDPESGKNQAAENTGGSGKESLEGAHVFMFKSTGNSFGDLMYEGFEEYLSGKGQKTVYKSPAETTVAAQVQMLDELITQKVASITISTNGDAGYDEVFKKAKQDILVCQPVSILAWFQQEKPEILSKVQYIFSVKDYIRFRLTQEACAEYTDFSGGNLINLNTKSYDKELLECFGIGTLYDKFPPLKESADICGYITKEAADLTGLIEGTPVAAGMFDVNACGIASGLDREEKLCMIAGTWSINEFICKHPIINGTVSLNSMFCIPGYYLVEESSPTSAGNMEWFIRNLMSYEKTDAQQSGRSIYDITNKWVEQIEPENNQLIFLPFLNGSNVAPLAKGSFVGLTAYHGKEHMLRAVYEGVVFSHYTHVRKLLLNREKPKAVQLSGGAANSDVWVQIFADVLQIPVEVMEDKELGAMGAAITAGIAAGVYQDYGEAIKRTVRIKKTVYPRSEYAEIYEQKYRQYQKVIEALDSVWDEFRN